MKYLIGTVSLIIFLCLTAGMIFCGYKALEDDIFWGFVLLGLSFPASVALLITQAAFTAASEY